MQKIASFLIQKHGLYESFYVANMDILRIKILDWRSFLPTVKPYYAMKCNPDETILKEMIANNTGFDCASRNEIATVLKLGAKPSDIIFAHPVKKIDDLKYAVTQGITYTTFDSVSELQKIKDHAPNMQCVIRLRVDNPSARVQLGLKYGVAQHEYKKLVDYAQQSHLDIVGTSFHVGSASKDPKVFREGISYCKDVFAYAESKGFKNMHLLDIGGGFTKETFKDAAVVISESITEHFPPTPSKHLKVIAEPGRYFAEETFSFFTPIIGQKEKDGRMEYWMSDGLYGSFNCIIYDQQIPLYQVLRNPLLGPLSDHVIDDTPRPSILWGASCDTYDKITQETIDLPLLRNGDYIHLDNFGAYTISAAKDFNGIKMTNIPTYYVGGKPHIPLLN